MDCLRKESSGGLLLTTVMSINDGELPDWSVKLQGVSPHPSCLGTAVSPHIDVNFRTREFPAPTPRAPIINGHECTLCSEILDSNGICDVNYNSDM
jgi:hypothetical protein